MIGPYLVLFGADEAQLSPLQVGVFISVIAVSGLAVSAWLGRRYDQSASRAPAFIALVAPAVGYLALTTTTRYAPLLLIAAAFLGAGMAAFPQLFTLARPHLDLSAGSSARRGTPALRSVWSLGHRTHDRRGRAGMAGIPRADGAHRPGFGGGRRAVAAARRHTGRAPAGDADSRLTRPMLLVAASFTLFHTAMLTGSVALPLYLTQTLERPGCDVGLLFSVCALVEVPAALSLMLLPARVRKHSLILLGQLPRAGHRRRHRPGTRGGSGPGQARSGPALMTGSQVP